LVYSCSSPISDYSSTSAAEIQMRNSEIFRRNIIESYDFNRNPESFVTELLDEGDSDFASPPGILYNKNYSSETDFVNAMFDHIKPILAKEQVPFTQHYAFPILQVSHA
jgi:hypothetical protein